MKSRYIRRLIFKDWLPLFIVFLTVATLVFIISLSNVDIYDDRVRLSVLPLTIPFTLLAFILPLFVYNYKFSLKSSDAFNQLPFKEKEMRNTRGIAGLIALLSVIIICFIIGFIFFTIRFYSSPKDTINSYINYYYDEEKDIGIEIPMEVTLYRGTYHPGMFMVLLPIVLVGIALEYFISCFLTSLTNKPFTAILFNTSIQMLLFGLLASILLTVEHFYLLGNELGVYSETFANINQCYQYTLLFAPGIMLASGLSDFISYNFVLNGEFNSAILEGVKGFAFYSSIAFALIVGLVAAFFVFYMKEVSGEHSGNYGLYQPKYNFLIYLSALPVFLSLLSSEGKYLSLYLILDIIIVAGYYFVNAMFLGTFKIKKYHYIILGSMAVLFFLTYFL